MKQALIIGQFTGGASKVLWGPSATTEDYRKVRDLFRAGEFEPDCLTVSLWESSRGRVKTRVLQAPEVVPVSHPIFPSTKAGRKKG